jgi:hypothetical protein
MFRTIMLSALVVLVAGCATSRPSTLAHEEARACGGISDDDLKNAPFARPEEITSVQPLLVEAYPRDDNPPTYELGGAVVTVRASRGMTSEWLQRLVDCDLARGGMLADSVPEVPNAPLAFRDASAYVRSTGDGFAIEMSSDKQRIAREILASAERLDQQPLLVR